MKTAMTKNTDIMDFVIHVEERIETKKSKRGKGSV